MSTAEAVSTGYAAGIHAYYYSACRVEPEHLVHHLVGTALKDAPDDLKKLRHYFNHVVKTVRMVRGRSITRRGCTWSRSTRGLHERSIAHGTSADIFSVAGPLVFFPVRHHSPTAALMVRRLIAEIKPAAVLIEGRRISIRSWVNCISGMNCPSRFIPMFAWRW